MKGINLHARRKELLHLRPSEIISNENRPRVSLDMYEISQLAESLRLNGMLHPLTVRKTERGYVLISGERRLRAAFMAGFETVPCILSNTEEKQSAYLSILENTHRKALDMFEEAEAISLLIDRFSVSQAEAAEHLLLAPSTLSNKLRLLKLGHDERRLVLSAGLSERHARAALRVGNDARLDLLQDFVNERMTAPEAELYVDSLLKANPTPPDEALNI